MKQDSYHQFSSELRHVQHDTPLCTYTAIVATLHIPTNTRYDRPMKFLSRHHMLELLDQWNGQQPGRWVYWSI